MDPYVLIQERKKKKFQKYLERRRNTKQNQVSGVRCQVSPACHTCHLYSVTKGKCHRDDLVHIEARADMRIFLET